MDQSELINNLKVQISLIDKSFEVVVIDGCKIRLLFDTTARIAAIAFAVSAPSKVGSQLVRES